MVEPSVKRSVVSYLKQTYDVGIKRLCSLVGWSRSTWYYESKIDDSEIISKYNELVERYPNRGFENYYDRSRREGYKWAWSRMLRVYRQMGLVRRPKTRRKLDDRLKRPLEQPSAVNKVWSMDFMSDSLSDGRTFRVLNVIDDFNRESLLNHGSTSFPSHKVIRHLEELLDYYGKPEQIRTDNGPEFISKTYKNWCQLNGIEAIYIQPGKPMQNAYIERFNRTFREDVLDAYLFSSISQFQIITDKWSDDYHNNHPHNSLGKGSPREYGKSATTVWG